MSKERAAQLVDAGIWLKLSGDREGARKLFERALKLDPTNEKAAQLLAGPDEASVAPPAVAEPIAPSVPSIAPVTANPFEPPAASPPGSNERAWNLATQKPAPAPAEPILEDDWGRLTGASTPVPQAAPAAEAGAVLAGAENALNVVLSGSDSPVPQPAPGARPRTMVEFGAAPQRTPTQQWGKPTSPPAAPAAPGARRPTLSDWGTQVGFDSPPPIAPVVPVPAPAPGTTLDEWAKAGATPSPRTTLNEWAKPAPAEPAPAPRTTLNEWSKPAPAEPAPAEPAPAPRTTLNEWTSPPAEASPKPVRPTMSDWGTQIQFDSPPPIAPVIPPVAPLPPPAAPAEPPRSTLHQWGGSSGSSLVQAAPMFSGPASTDSSPMIVRIGGDPGPESPPPMTPPLFASPPSGLKPEPPTPAEMGDLPLPVAEAPVELPAATAAAPAVADTVGFAWGWSASSAPAPSEPEEPPEPRPSPTLSPSAESAWDQRSNPGIKLEAVVGRDKALDLISSDSKLTRAPPSKKDEVRTILRGAKDLLELDDHTGAMELIQKAESIAPDDPEVISMRERSEKTLLTMFESKLGKLEAIPRVLLKDDEIIWLNLDHRAGFVLAQIDGTVTFDDLFSVSGMSRIDTARILAQLVEEGVISRG